MDAPATTLFASYEQDFHHIIQGIRDKLEGDGRDERGEQRKASLRKVEMDLDEADEMVGQMELEIQGIPQSIKPQYQPRLRAAKAELNRYKKLSKDAHTVFSRSDLLNGNRRGGMSISDDPYGPGTDRTRLLAGTEILQDGSRRLVDSQRIALETEEQGADILRSLRGQREQIENASNTLRTADTSIDRATGTIKKMIRQMYKQRFILSAIVVFLVMLIALILWFKLFRH